MGEQHANGWRVSRHRLVADVTVGVIANPMSGRDIRRLVASASVFPNAEKVSDAPYIAVEALISEADYEAARAALEARRSHHGRRPVSTAWAADLWSLRWRDVLQAQRHLPLL